MTDTGENPPADAISRVLEAERQAHERVARCEAEAAAHVETARTRVRRVVERTDARVSALRTRVERQVAERVTALRAEAEGIRGQPPEEDVRQAQLEAAVARLAARLTGESP